jgi:hypothetical protein
MPTRRVVKGVLSGFLGTYTSRYSTYRGFWLFGFLVEHVDRMEVDLLNAGGSLNDSPQRTRARELAVQRFADQLSKHGFDRSLIRSAQLEIVRLPDDGSIQGQHFRGGYNLSFLATVTTDNGKRFEREQSVFVAPHDPQRELASAFAR